MYLSSAMLKIANTGSFSSKIRTRQSYLFFLFNIILERLAKAIQEEKGIKHIQIGKENEQFSTHYDMMLKTSMIISMHTKWSDQ
jgi:hypothetical protein